MVQAESPFGVYVQDDAAMLQQQTQEILYNNAVWLNQQTGSAQVGVVTVANLGDQTLEELAVARFRTMGLGSKERNDGVLILYTSEENHVRIEVGYGLEGRIPDGKAGAILDQYFLPNMQAGNVDDAFLMTQLALIQEIAAEYGVETSGITGGQLPSDAYGSDQQAGGFWDGLPGYVKFLLIIGIALLVILDFKFTGGAITYALFSMLSRGGSRGRWGGGGRGGGGSSGGGGASR